MGNTLEQPTAPVLKPRHLAFSLLLLNPVAGLVSAGNYVSGTFAAFERNNLSLPFILTFLAAFAVTALAMTILHRWGHDLQFGKAAFTSFILLLAGGCTYAAAPFAPGALLWLVISAALSAAGTAVSLYCWMAICTPFPFKTALLWGAATLCLASILALTALATSNAWIMLAVGAFSPCIAAAALFALRASWPSNHSAHPVTIIEKQGSPIGSFLDSTWPVLAGALLCLFLLGLMWTEPQRTAEFPHSAGITQGTFGGFIVSAGAFAAVAFLYPSEKNLRGACLSFAPIVITLPLAACILTVDPAGVVGYLLGGLTGTACSFFAVLSLAILLESETSWHVPLPVAGGRCSVATCFVLAVGIVANQLVESGQTMSITLALFVAYLVALATRALRTATRTGKDEQSEATVDLREETCEKIVRTNGLSPRESEVLALLARGRSSTRIAQELYVSPETVKVHVKHIYEKTGVHTRQELLDLFE